MSTDPATPPATPQAAPPIGPVVPPAAHGPPPVHTDQPDWAPFVRAALVAAVAGWVLYAVAGFANLGAAHTDTETHAAEARFFLGYLSGYVFWASLPLGAMALLMIRYLARTSWGLLLTRPFEAATRTLPLTIILWVPLVAAVNIGDVSPYWWSNPHTGTHDPAHNDSAHAGEKDNKDNKDKAAIKRDEAEKISRELVHRAEYQKKIDDALDASIKDAHHKEEHEIQSGNNHFLTPMAFMFVGAVLFAIWGGLIFFLNKWGKETSDATDPKVVDRGLEKLQNISGPGLIIFAITTTVAASQWVMSLEPGWASTMFPVIYAVNQFLTCFAFCLALFLLLASRPPFKDHMRPKFQIDMGTLMLAFTLFWSYTSFSQFMLVWIGNLPEEIPFYLKRSNHEGTRNGWWYVSAALIALHFALPFLLLLFRNIKMHPVRLRVVATYLVLICMVDVIWWIAPSAKQHNNFPAWLMDVGAIFGVGGLWALYFIHNLKQRPLFPDNQAFLLPEGHTHGHH